MHRLQCIDKDLRNFVHCCKEHWPGHNQRLKVQMNCLFFFIAEFERAAKIRKIVVYRCYQSESVKFVTSCAEHVDGTKK